MYVDLMSYKNYIMVNLSLIKHFGLKGAVYCSELMSLPIIDPVTLSVRVDRKAIEEKLDISEDEQFAIEAKLKALDLLRRDKKDNTLISLDVRGLEILIVNIDNLEEDLFTEKDLADIKKNVGIKSKEENERNARIRCFQQLKKGIVCDNFNIKKALHEWLDALCDGTKIKLTKTDVKAFVETLLSYSKGDEKVALAIIAKAVSHRSKDCAVAIMKYNESKSCKKSNDLLNGARTNVQQRATQEDIDGGESW